MYLDGGCVEASINTARTNGDGGGTKVCARCGDTGHFAGDKTADGRLICQSVCSECPSRMCVGCWRVPGAPGGPCGPCAVMADVMPEMESLKNAAGHPYKKKVYDALVADRTKHRLKMGVKVTRTTDTAAGDSDDDVADQYRYF